MSSVSSGIEQYHRCPQCSFMIAVTVDEKTGGLATNEIGEPGGREFTSLDAAVDETAADAEIILGGLLEQSNAAGDNMAEFSTALKSLSGQLNTGKGNLKTIIATAITAANNAQTRNTELEKRLAESSHQIEQLKDALSQVRSEADTDPLTGIATRGVFDRELPREVKRANAKRPLSLMMLDIDFFKKVNDTYGHQVGDFVLRRLAAVLKQITKGKDIAARYGGEEFAIILPDTNLVDAHKLAETIRAGVNATPLKDRAMDVNVGRISISVGVSSLKPGEEPKELIRRADEALYKAKHEGRNRVIIAC